MVILSSTALSGEDTPLWNVYDLSILLKVNWSKGKYLECQAKANGRIPSVHLTIV